LRPEKKFASVEELKAQIAADKENSTNYFKELH
jgi:FAD synthase